MRNDSDGAFGKTICKRLIYPCTAGEFRLFKMSRAAVDCGYRWSRRFQGYAPDQVISQVQAT
jgi:hypothetical protein